MTWAERCANAPVAAFTVTLSAPSATTVTVDYETVGGTAVAGSDYATTTGTLTFAPGESQQTVLVEVMDNSAAELNEAFAVALSNPSAGATIADGVGTATIFDDDIKFFVVNDAASDRAYEYAAAGNTNRKASPTRR